jgi:hypothetical protein
MDKIKKMIKREKEDALHNFKQTDFETQLARRIRLASTARPKKSFFSIMQRRPAFAAVIIVVLLVMVVGITAFFSHFAGENDRAKIERLLLAKFPGLQQKIPADVEKEISLSLTEEDALRMELEWRVKQQFYTVSSRDYKKEELIAKVGKMFEIEDQYEEKQEEEIIFTEPVDPVKLNLEERIKALRQGKKIQWLYQ